MRCKSERVPDSFCLECTKQEMLATFDFIQKFVIIALNI